MYTAGIPIGLLVDTRGPRPGALMGAMLLGVGYFSLYRGMDFHVVQGLVIDIAIAYAGGPDSISIPWLCFFAFLTGVGGCASFAGAVKTCKTRYIITVDKCSCFQPR